MIAIADELLFNAEMNPASVCTATAKYDCIAERDQLLRWEVAIGNQQLFSPSFNEFLPIGTSFTLTSFSDIIINAVLTSIDLTYIHSVLIMNYNISFHKVHVVCNDVMKDPNESGK